MPKSLVVPLAMVPLDDHKPRFTLAKLDAFAKQRAWRDVPICGKDALKIISKESRAHAEISIARIPPLAQDAKDSQEKAKQKDAKQREQRRNLQSEIVADTENSEKELKEIMAAAENADHDSAKRMLEETKLIQDKLKLRLRQAQETIGNMEAEIKANTARLEIIANLRSKTLPHFEKKFQMLAVKGSAAYVLGLAGYYIIGALVVVAELVIAYVVSKWLEPSVAHFLSFEKTVLMLFFVQYFGFDWLISRIEEALCWSIYKRLLRNISSAIGEFEKSEREIRAGLDGVFG